MSSTRDVLRIHWPWVAFGFLILLWAAIAIPNLNRSRVAADKAAALARQRSKLAELRPASLQVTGTEAADQSSSVDDGRKLVRTSAIEMFVRVPDQSCSQITQLAYNAGGYVVTSQVSGSQQAPNASLTIRVPVAKFEDVRAQIRRLGLRVESESIEAQDVTRQYVDE